MLVDKHNGNVFPVVREGVESALDRGNIRLLVDDQVVLLRVRGFGDVLFWPGRQDFGDSDDVVSLRRWDSEEGVEHTPTPASRMPVTVSWEHVVSCLRSK